MSSPQDPFAPPGDGEQPSGQQPPDYGSQPPAYGAQPPAYGAQPPAYGSQPPASGAQPPASGSQPAPYGAQQPGYGSQPGSYGPPPAYGGGPVATKNSLGVWSVVLAAVAFLCVGPLASIPGVILGHLALKANREQLADNFGMSMTGTVANWLLTVWNIGVLVWFVWFGGWEWLMMAFDDAMVVP